MNKYTKIQGPSNQAITENVVLPNGIKIIETCDNRRFGDPEGVIFETNNGVRKCTRLLNTGVQYVDNLCYMGGDFWSGCSNGNQTLQASTDEERKMVLYFFKDLKNMDTYGSAAIKDKGVSQRRLYNS